MAVRRVISIEVEQAQEVVDAATRTLVDPAEDGERDEHERAHEQERKREHEGGEREHRVVRRAGEALGHPEDVAAPEAREATPGPVANAAQEPVSPPAIDRVRAPADEVSSLRAIQVVGLGAGVALANRPRLLAEPLSPLALLARTVASIVGRRRRSDPPMR